MSRGNVGRVKKAEGRGKQSVKARPREAERDADYLRETEAQCIVCGIWRGQCCGEHNNML